MKKYIVMLVCGLLAGCADGQGFLKSVSEADSVDLKACLTQEAANRIQDGSALAAPVRTTVKKMVVACLIPNADAEDRQNATQLAQDILIQLMKQ